MAFPLPAGMVLATENIVYTDDDVAAIEAVQSSSTRMLVGIQFAFKWPGFGVAANAADALARNIAGMNTWPELDRVVYADPDGSPIWYFAYLSSPVWWVPIMIACGVAIAAAITLRVVWTVVPEEFRAPIAQIGEIMPMIMIIMLISVVMPMLQEKGGLFQRGN